jgi:hypothetical protein
MVTHLRADASERQGFAQRGASYKKVVGHVNSSTRTASGLFGAISGDQSPILWRFFGRCIILSWSSQPGQAAAAACDS